MRALVLEATDQPPVIREVPDPQPGEGEAVVRLTAAALNHRDLWIMQGKYPGIHHPIILGSDGCGIVERGPEAWLGQSVVLCPSLDWGPNPRFQQLSYQILGLPRDGTFAEQVIIPVENLVKRPKHLSPTVAAALPLAHLTAWRALMSRAGLKTGERVLISGVGGGVALAALQLAVASGARVFVTSSDPQKIERAIAMGAEGGALYTDPDWVAQLQQACAGGFDVVIDSAGGEGFGGLLKMLAMGGRLAFYGGTRGRWPEILPQHLFYKQASIFGSTMGSPIEFAEMVEFIEIYQIEPVIDHTTSLDAGAAAFAYLATGAQFGKVVLTMGT